MKQSLVPFIAVALLSACAYQPAERPISFLGDPAPLGAETATIVIQPNTKWVNVTGGDTIKFVTGDKAFAWAFNVATSVKSFELNRVAPPGMLDHRVIAYVSPDPKYMGGDGERSK
jgi:hypothetical protein